MPSLRRVPTPAATAELTAAAFAAPDQQLCGVELEWPVHRRGDPSARASLHDLRAVAARPLPYGSRVTIEPGGQVELSTRAAPTADATLDMANAETGVLHRRLRAAGLEPTELAFDARRGPRRILADPRYACMESFLEHGGGRPGARPDSAGAWMMCNTASLQVNVSHDSADPQRRWQLAHRLGPVLVAAFANSPGLDRRGRRWQSLRQAVWSAIDPRRTRAVGTRQPGPRAWTEYALAADVMLIRSANGTMFRPVEPGLPFGRWLAEGHPAGWPTAEDLCYHLTTLFPPIRPRGWLELRMLDLLPPELREVATLVVLTALTTEAGTQLEARLPDTAPLWGESARWALGHPVLAAAAGCLLEVVLGHVEGVTADRSRRDAVVHFAERYVARGTAPAQLVGDEHLTAPFAPDLDRGWVRNASLTVRSASGISRGASPAARERAAACVAGWPADAAPAG